MKKPMKFTATLIAVALVCAGCSVDIADQVCDVSTSADVDAFAASQAPSEEPTAGGTPSPVRTGYQGQFRQVLVVTQTIPDGFAVRQLVDAPTVYLSARAVPEQFACDTTISTIAQLQELGGYVTATDVEAGRFLDTRQLLPDN